MITKHRGVYWVNRRNVWVVQFRTDGKVKSFGRFSSFEDAVKRADEVWATLPVAKRSQRVCECCKQKQSNQLFYWGKSTCKACWKKSKADPWNKWAKLSATKLRKDSRRKATEVGWVKWARVKRIAMCNRRPKSNIVRKTKHARTWQDWCEIERSRWMSNCSQRKAKGWDKKTKQWTTSIMYREQKRLRKMNCES